MKSKTRQLSNQQTKPPKTQFSIRSTAKRFLGTVLFWRRAKSKAPNSKTTQQQHLQPAQDRDLYSSDNSTGSNKNTSGVVVVGTLEFTLKDIQKATDNFSPSNKIGEGGFGTVYKGKLKNGSLVAVKRSKQDRYDKHLWSQFKNEILVLSKIEHHNLVRLLGYVEHENERIVVIEYISNGTLREHLNGTRGIGLEIAERLDIAIDVAQAVTYLHQYAHYPIIHRDIKASNILITEKFSAKVADFGIARVAVENPDATHISTQIKGTVGYLDPEYLRTYQLTEKSDVYSFGVLLVEMMTGRHPIESAKPLNERLTIKWAMHRVKHGDAILAMDPRMRRSPASNMAVEKVLKLAAHCVAPSRQTRPSMEKCGEVLSRIREDFREKRANAHPGATSHHSADVIERKGRHQLFGIEDGDSYGFRSA